VKPGELLIVALLPKIVPSANSGEKANAFEVIEIEKLNFDLTWKEDLEKIVNISDN